VTIPESPSDACKVAIDGKKMMIDNAGDLLLIVTASDTHASIAHAKVVGTL
jgi:hypothetical protein